jgi:hypothetical protein
MRPAHAAADVFCAQVPAKKFMGKRRVFKFWDRQAAVASAQGLSDMKIKVRRDGSIKLKTHGRRAKLRHRSQGMLQVVVGFRDPAAGDAGNVCSTVTQPFHLGRKGRLLAP